MRVNFSRKVLQVVQTEVRLVQKLLLTTSSSLTHNLSSSFKKHDKLSWNMSSAPLSLIACSECQSEFHFTFNSKRLTHCRFVAAAWNFHCVAGTEMIGDLCLWAQRFVTLRWRTGDWKGLSYIRVKPQSCTTESKPSHGLLIHVQSLCCLHSLCQLHIIFDWLSGPKTGRLLLVLSL